MNATTDTLEAAAAIPTVPGWYGKLPCLGDFASRRLPPEFITPWDAWLQRSIASSRQQLGERWLDIYLTSPMWRFILAPGVCGEQPIAGLLLPSVDKVGRYFPLTLALPLDKSRADLASLLASQRWFDRLEKIGLAALDVDYSIDALEAALTANPFPAQDALPMPPGTRDMLECMRDPQPLAQSFYLDSVENLAGAASAGARAVIAACTAEKSYWWSVAQDSLATEFHYSGGLLADDYFTVLLGGCRVETDSEALSTDPLQALDSAASR